LSYPAASLISVVDLPGTKVWNPPGSDNDAQRFLGHRWAVAVTAGPSGPTVLKALIRHGPGGLVPATQIETRPQTSLVAGSRSAVSGNATLLDWLPRLYYFYPILCGGDGPFRPCTPAGGDLHARHDMPAPANVIPASPGWWN
jgi:hypothetical protein